MASSATEPCACEGECQIVGIWKGDVKDALYLYQDGVRYLVRSGLGGIQCYRRCKESIPEPAP